MFCPKCGEKFSDSLRYCPNCSTKVSEELSENEAFGQSAEEIKKEKWKSFYFWPIISIVAATVMGLVAFVGGRLLSGACSVAAIVLCVIAILIRKGIIKSKTVRFSILLIMFSFLLILQYIAVFSFDINTYKKLEWPSTTLSEKIPEAEFKYGKVFESSENKLIISVYHVSEDAFKNYVEACKNTEFVFEESKAKNYKIAYSDDGYKLTVDYDKKKVMRISIEEGEPFVPNENGGSLDFMLDYIPQHFPN